MYVTRYQGNLLWRLRLLILFLCIDHGPVMNAAESQLSSSIHTGPRTALVIGNSDYRQLPLANPVNDVRAIAKALEQVGFIVTKLENATRKQIFESIRSFGERLKREGGDGLFYFAGHGAQVKGQNFLIPVDADIRHEDEVAYNAFDVEQVLEKMESASNRVNILILDACRDNPFKRSFRSSASGLAHMEAPDGSFIAFATAPGRTADDGSGSHGLYAQHLLTHILTPGLKIEDIFKRVRVGVQKGSGGEQTPWESTSLKDDFYFIPSRSSSSPSPGPAQYTNNTANLDLEFWNSIKESTSPADYKAYLKKYPRGQFTELAENRLAVLSAAPSKEKPTTDKPTRPFSQPNTPLTDVRHSPGWSSTGFSFKEDSEKLLHSLAKLPLECRKRVHNKKVLVLVDERYADEYHMVQEDYGSLVGIISFQLQAFGLRTFTNTEQRQYLADLRARDYFTASDTVSVPLPLDTDFILRGVIRSIVAENPILKINEVHMDIWMDLREPYGRILADATTPTSSYAGMNTLSMAMELVKEEADDLLAQLFEDYCKTLVIRLERN
jgi:hypothetical protein